MSTRITTIKGASLKGRNFTDSIAPVTVFVGPNGAGKTARIDAILLALAGQHPKLGKQNASIFRLSSGSVMAAYVSLSDGTFVERRWEERRGSVSMERNGCDLNVPPVALDAGEYFSLSERDRLALVFRLHEGEQREYGPDIAAKVKGIRIESPTAEIEKMLGRIATEIMGHWDSREGNPAQWLDAFAAHAKQKKSEAAAAAKRMTGTVAGITELRAQAAAPSQDAEREREKAAQAVVTLTTEIDRLQARLAADDETVKRRHALGSEVETLRGLRDGLSEQFKRREELEAQTDNRSPQSPSCESRVREDAAAVATAKAKIAQLQEELRKAETQAEARRQFEAILDLSGENETALMETDQFVKFNSRTMAEYRSRLPECEQDVSKANKSEHAAKVRVNSADARLHKVRGKLHGLAHQESCPYCKTEGTAWKTTLAAELATALAEATAEFDSASAAHDAAVAASGKADEALESARQEHEANEQLKSKLAAATARYAAAAAEKRRAQEGSKLLTARDGVQIAAELETAKRGEGASREAHEEALAALQQARVVDGELFARRSELTRLRRDLSAVPDYDAMIARKEGEIAALPAPMERASVSTHLTSLAESLTAAKQRLEVAKQKAAQLVTARAEAAAKLKAAEAAEATRSEASVWESVREFVDAAQAESVEKAFKPLLAVANRIAGSVLKTPLQYRAGEIGRMEGRTWVSHQTFSGSEQAVTYAALSVALAAASPLRVAIVDELDRLTPENKTALMEAVVKAVADGVLDQFIGCDVRPADYAGLNQVTTINL